VVVYIDDVIITAPTMMEHLQRLKEVLKRVDDAELRLKFSKCKFLQDEVVYLGFKINKNGIRTIDAKVKNVRETPKPENVSQLRSFLGSINYYARFIPNLATKMQLLYDCLKKNNGVRWTKACDEAFKKIKNKLASEKFLIHYDPLKPLVLTCDASPHGVVAVVSRRINGNDYPIHYASRILINASERNYSQLDREG